MVVRVVVVLGVILIALAYAWKVRCAERVVSVVRRYALPGMRTVLDLGCGRCCSLSALRGVRVTSLDVVDRGVCASPRLFDGRTIPYADGTFDLGVCAFVLHHTRHQRRLLRELARTCRRVLVLEDTPDAAWEWSLARAHARSAWGSCARCFHDDAAWRSIFAACGLRVLAAERLPRWECPFAVQPWFYPITRHAYHLGS